jgi:glycosyltransferase 2 family protein
VRVRGRLLLGGLLAVPLLFLFLRGVAWAELTTAFSTARPGYLLGVLFATLVAYALRAWRWGYLLAPLARVPFGRLFSVTFVGFMSGLLVPRAGEVVRPYLIARHHRVRTSAAFASIILERLADLLAVVALFGLYLYVLPMPIEQRRGPLLGMLRAAGLLAGIGALLVLVVLLAFHVHADKAMALVDRLLGFAPRRLARPLSEALRSFGDGLAVLRAPAPHLIAILLQSFALWLSIGAGIYCNSEAFGHGLPFRSSFLIMGFLTVGVAVPTPGFVGGFHESYLIALTEAFGLEKGVAAASGIALHALNTLPVLVLGLAYLGREGLTLGKVAEMTEEGAEGQAEAEGRPGEPR